MLPNTGDNMCNCHTWSTHA